MTALLLFDSNVWSHLVLKRTTQDAKVQTDIDALLLKYQLSSRCTSRICVAEALVGARRLLDGQQRMQLEAALMEEFENAQLLIVDVVASILDRAATLRAESLRRAASKRDVIPAGADGGKLKLPDAIIAATCLEFDPPAILVTENDKDFRYIDDQGVSCTVGNLIIERVG